jgi:hypothetical protein
LPEVLREEGEEEGQGQRGASRPHFLAFSQGAAVVVGEGEVGDQVQQQQEQEQELGEGRAKETCVWHFICL